MVVSLQCTACRGRSCVTKKVSPWVASQQQMIVVMKKPAEKLAHQPVITQANPANEEGTGELYCVQRHQAAVTAVRLEIQDWCK